MTAIQKYEELGFTNDFMFSRIMQDQKICKPFLEMILDIKIDHIEYLESQKTIDLKVDAKSVRLDIFVDDGKTVYNCEMQTSFFKNIPKRSRYYQGFIDMDLIEKGADYSKLKKSFVIFICTFDLFGKNGYIYTFENRCVEYPDLRLGDDAIKVFVNVNGKDDSHISSELKELLTYIRTSKIPDKCVNPLINNMDEALRKARSNEEWRKEYMMLAVLCISMVGCGKKDSGSELLTEVQETVTPVEEVVKPEGEETPEGIRLHVYSGDESAENIVQHTVYVNEITENTVMRELTEALEMDENAGINSISFGTYGGDKVVMLDLNQAFEEYVNKLGSSGEYIVMGSLTDTFLDCYQSELLLVTVDGKVLKTGHNIYEEYLEMYPYTEATYQIREEKLTGDGLEISCPQIDGFRDERIQEKWNQIMLATEQTVMDQWEGNGTYRVTYTVKTMTPDTLSILMDGTVNTPDTPEEYTFKYTYNIDLNTGESIRLKDHVDVEKLAENMFAGTGYYVKEDLADYFRERLEAIYDSPDALAQSLAGYDYSEDGTAPYGYSYLADGKVWICMEVPHALGDYNEIELDTQ